MIETGKNEAVMGTGLQLVLSGRGSVLAISEGMKMGADVGLSCQQWFGFQVPVQRASDSLKALAACRLF